MKTFAAKCVSCENENGIVVVGFADNEMETTEYLLLQRTLEPDAQDRELGQDKIHLELGSQLKSGYGGVDLIHLFGSTLKVYLDEVMGRALGVSTIEIDLAEAQFDDEILKEHLSLVVGDEPILRVS